MTNAVKRKMTHEECERLLELYEDKRRRDSIAISQLSDIKSTLLRLTNLQNQYTSDSMNKKECDMILQRYICEMESKYDPFMNQPEDIYLEEES